MILLSFLLSTYLSISIIYLSIHLAIYLHIFIYSYVFTIYRSIHQSIKPFIHQSINLLIHLNINHLDPDSHGLVDLLDGLLVLALHLGVSVPSTKRKRSYFVHFMFIFSLMSDIMIKLCAYYVHIMSSPYLYVHSLIKQCSYYVHYMLICTFWKRSYYEFLCSLIHITLKSCHILP